MILYCAADLIFATRIKGAADAVGVPARPARSVEKLLTLLKEETVKGLVVDLEAGEVVFDLLRAVKAAAPAVRTLAYGPHVNVEGLAAAEAAGADEVMARGRFAAELPMLLRSIEGA